MSSSRRKLFAGPLGWVTILNLTLLSGVMMALLGAKLVRGRVQMDAAWMAGIAAASTLWLLLLLRSEADPKSKRLSGIAWACITIGVAIGLDANYPKFQRLFAISNIRTVGGNLTQNEDGGMVIDLGGSRCTDADLKRLLPQLKYFSQIAELRLNNTAVTDAGLDAISKTFQETKMLQRLDTTGAKVTTGGVLKLQRTLGDVDIRTSSAGLEK